MRRVLKFLVILSLLLLLLPVAALFVLSFFNTRTEISAAFTESVVLHGEEGVLQSPLELKVATFNIQDLPFIGENRPERMRAIAMKLLVLDPDVVGFQEAFVEADRNLLIAELKNTRLQHHQYYGSGMVGSGLLISSAYPIEEAWFTQFAESGPWFKLWEGDFWAGKGVALARLALPDGLGYLDFFNTHAQAGYGNPYYKQVRLAQLRQMAQFINDARAIRLPGLVVGDINCRPDSEEYNALVSESGLVRLMTLDSGIDHIFGIENDAYAYEVLETHEIAERVRVNQKEFDLSDHSGYISTIRISPKESTS